MTENLMNKSHKATNPKSREGYEKIKWDHAGKVGGSRWGGSEKVRGKWGETTNSSDANEFFNKFVKT
jgi:hypothetical protein